MFLEDGRWVGAALSCLQVTLQGDEAGVWSGTCILHYIKKKKNLVQL